MDPKQNPIKIGQEWNHYLRNGGGVVRFERFDNIPYRKKAWLHDGNLEYCMFINEDHTLVNEEDWTYITTSIVCLNCGVFCGQRCKL